VAPGPPIVGGRRRNHYSWRLDSVRRAAILVSVMSGEPNYLLPIGSPDRSISRPRVRALRSATSSDRHPGFGYGASAANIMRRSHALSPSSDGDRPLRATN